MRTPPVFTLLLAIASAPLAAQSVPNVFSDNSPALADEVNENFTAITNSLSSTEARVDQLEAAAVDDPVTHLNVAMEEIFYVQSYCLDNNNSLNNKFYYERSSNEFEIPSGYSFVVTDIFASPGGCPTLPTTSDFYLAVVDGPRTFTIQFSGRDTKHYALSGGLTYPAGREPTPRNTGSSSRKLQIQLIGYFIEGDAPQYGEGR